MCVLMWVRACEFVFRFSVKLNELVGESQEDGTRACHLGSRKDAQVYVV